MGGTFENLSPLICSLTEQTTLIKLSHLAIDEALQARDLSKVQATSVSPTLVKDAATFVTLTIAGKLRGCVGTLIAREPVYKSVMRNAVGAALSDTRFAPLSLEESASIAIHISILSPLLPLQFGSIEELLSRLTPGEDGVVLKQAGSSATYLPQVWEKLPEKIPFLQSLSRKAGLGPDAWRNPGAELLIYRVSDFGDTEAK